MLGRLLSVGGFTALSRLAGFARDVLMAAIMGAGAQSDAFMVAFRLPNNFRAIFAEGAFNAAFLPRYTAAATKEKAGKEDAGSSSAAAGFANDVFAWQILAQLVLLFLAFAFMRQIIAVLAPGFTDNPGQMSLAIELARITFPFLFCIAIVTQLSGMLNAKGKFRAAAASPILLNIAMVVTLLSAGLFPSVAHAAAYGVFAAGILELIFMVYVAGKSGLVLRLRLPRWRPEMREFFVALGNATIGAGGVQIGLFLDTVIASFLPAGDLTSLYYADRINQLPMGVIGVALGTVLLPEMSAKLAAKDEKGASLAQNRAVILGLLLTLPCIAAFFIVPETLMRALFARGAFDLAAAGTAAAALMAYGIGLPAFVLVRCIVPSFYARGDTATPVRATLLSVVANVLMKIVLVWGLSFGAVGLALGTSLGGWVNVAVLAYLARRRGVLVATPELRRGLMPVILSTGAAALGLALGVTLGNGLVSQASSLQSLVSFGLACLLGASFYALTVFALRRKLPFRGLGK